MATTKILTLLDALVTRVEDEWGPEDPDAVERLYQTPVDVATIEGRKVWFFPAESDDEPETRSERRYGYRVGVVVAERYTDAGQPPVEWMDARVDFVTDLAGWLEFGTGTANGLFSIGDREIFTQEREPVQVYDVAMLAEKKFFWSELEYVFGEVA